MAATKGKSGGESKEIRLRIVVVEPLAGVHWALQLGSAELQPPTRAKAAAIEFEFTIRADGETKEGTPRLLGPAAQGPPTGRFVYVNSGQAAGDANSWWTRRAKIPLGGITHAAIRKATADTVLEARFAGCGRDGGPTCGSVKLLGSGWTAK